MRRVLLVGAVLAAMAGAGIAYSATQGDGVPGGPAVWGGGHTTFPAPIGDRDVSVFAKNGGGTFLYGRYDVPRPVITGEVTCINVLGNGVVVAGIVRDAYFASQAIGAPFVWYAVDNGGPSAGARDLISEVYVLTTKDDDAWAGASPGFPHVCPSTVPSDVVFGALAGGDLVVQSVGHAATARENLIVNGDAEAAAGGDDTTVIAAPGWTSTGSFTVVDYALGEATFGPGELPGPTSPGPADGGKNFFSSGPPDSPTSTATQTVSLTPYARTVMHGATYVLSGWLGGYDGQDDNAALSVIFKDANNATVGTATIGPVLAADRSNVSSLVYRETAAPVPRSARSAVITLTMTRTGGAYNDGYADNLSLVIVP